MTREPDSRWHEYVADHDDLVARVDAWTVSDAVPELIADVLRVARALLIDSYFIYDYSLVATTWALLITEACLKDCLVYAAKGPDKRTFGQLIDEAHRRGLIQQDEANALRGVAELRNRVVHGHLKPKVSDLYSRAAAAK